MTDPSAPTDEYRCSWCSSTAGPDDAGRCRSCGATIVGDEVTELLPGVTDVDTLAIMKQRTAREPNRIVSWVTGDVATGETWAPAGEALEAPSPDVQREMLRLELDAAIAARQAEIDAMKAEEALEAVSQQGSDPTASLESTADEPSDELSEESPEA